MPALAFVTTGTEGNGVIVVVEGPSAAGKTTWATTQAAEALVREDIATEDPPSEGGLAARYWGQRGASRWAQALATERRWGTAWVDTDPLKLHYSWSLWRIGMGSETEFRDAVHAYRELLVERAIGFADAYFVSISDLATLTRHRSSDGTRRRRNFDLHVRLREPLREWYTALGSVRPGSIHWGFPPDGVAPLVEAPNGRYAPEDYDGLIQAVPSQT